MSWNFFKKFTGEWGSKAKKEPEERAKVREAIKRDTRNEADLCATKNVIRKQPEYLAETICCICAKPIKWRTREYFSRNELISQMCNECS